MPAINVFQPSHQRPGLNISCSQGSPIKPAGPTGSANPVYDLIEQARGRRTWTTPLTASNPRVLDSGSIKPTENKRLGALPDYDALALGKATALGLGVTLALWIGIHVGETSAADLDSAYRPLRLDPVELPVDPPRSQASSAIDVSKLIERFKVVGPTVSVLGIGGVGLYRLGKGVQRLEGIEKEIAAAKDETSKQFAAAKDETSKQFAAAKEDTAKQFAAVKEDTSKQFAAVKEDTAKQFAAAKEDTSKQFAAVKEDTSKQFAAVKEDTAKQFVAVKESVDKSNILIQRLDDKISRTDRTLSFLQGMKSAKDEAAKSL